MKKIIIIGATSGIGRGLAEVYSHEDYLIGITGRRENLLEEVCARDKDKLFYQVCDITDTQATISSLETLDVYKRQVVDTFTHDHLKQVKRFDELLLLF